MNIEEIMNDFDKEFSQVANEEEIGYYGWKCETDFYTVRQWVANKLLQAGIMRSFCKCTETRPLGINAGICGNCLLEIKPRLQNGA